MFRKRQQWRGKLSLWRLRRAADTGRRKLELALNMISLSGTWELRRDGDPLWQPVRVPGSWEQAGLAKDDAGPYWYRTSFYVPEEYAGKRAWLRFGAVSYACRIFVNGHQAGQHTGMWDAFNIEITDFIQPGKAVELLVWVEKPASLTAGPNSPTVPGKYPLREVLSGFLPYVWGHACGGIWQDVELYSTGKQYLTGVWVHGTTDGLVTASISASEPGLVQVTTTDPDQNTILNQTFLIDQTAEVKFQVPDPKPWSLSTPFLYTATICLPGNDQHTIRFGLRSVASQGRKLTLNHQPVYPRMILSWGWYTDLFYPNPGKAQVQADMLRLHNLGYNGIKLCLWFPPAYYFDLADEMGMLLWVELPMWLPLPKEGYHNQVRWEYDRLVRQARQHPSVVLYTLGCELSQAVDEKFLGQLYIQTKALTTGELVRDNSGSSEAYYGPLHEHADFDDNHLYCELQYMRPLLDAFSSGWRVERPWLMGEFCDYDTFPKTGTHWWASTDPIINPQGARWEMRASQHATRLEQLGMQECVSKLTTASYWQANIHRKHTIEAIRARGDVSGYVVTGEVDTPVSSAGMWDADGKSKFTPHEYISFNQDFVLTLGWDRRRAWLAGGDRPSPQDRFSYISGTLVRIHLVGSNFSQQNGQAQVTWEVSFPGEIPIASKHLITQQELQSGKVQGLTIIEFHAPEVTTPRQAFLRVQASIGDQQTENTWGLWFFPSEAWAGVPRFGLFDPINLLPDLPQLSGSRCSPGFDGVSVTVCSYWNEIVDAFVKGGGKVILLDGLNSPAGLLPVLPVPYWREALKLIEDHPAWGDFPHGNAPDMQFYTLAPDCAIDATGFPGKFLPIFRRLDMRGMELLEYAVELKWGDGRVILTTLRFAGGLGDQPVGLRNCPAGQHLLANWVRSLHL